MRRVTAALGAGALGLGVLSLGGAFAGGSSFDPPTVAATPAPAGLAEAILASGCFWCAESDFERFPGVRSVESGYAGGREVGPTYHQVSSGTTGHAEAIRVVYDPAQVSYRQLLDHWARHTDIFDGGGQFCDRGRQYRPVVFPRDAAQRSEALALEAALEGRFGKPVAFTIEDPGPFWLAEDYHQDFHVKSPARYRSYRAGCGRDARVRAIWGG